MTALEQLTIVSLILASPVIAFFITRQIRPNENVTGKNFLIWLGLTVGIGVIELIILGQIFPASSGL